MRQITSIFVISMLIFTAFSLTTNPVEGQFATNTPAGESGSNNSSRR